MAKKSYKPQNLRTQLSIILAVVILGGGALFYFGLEAVRTYSVSVNERIKDADATDKTVQQLQVLTSQVAQSEALIATANQLSIQSSSFQSQALQDVNNYASRTGLTVATTDFENAEATIIVRFANPVNYTSLLQFLALVEGNLPNMQVTSITLTNPPNGDANLVQVGDIKIKVLVK